MYFFFDRIIIKETVDVSGSLRKRHVDQLLSRPVGVDPSTNDSVIDQLPEMPSRMDTSRSDDLPSMSDDIPLAGSCQHSPVDNHCIISYRKDSPHKSAHHPSWEGNSRVKMHSFDRLTSGSPQEVKPMHSIT